MRKKHLKMLLTVVSLAFLSIILFSACSHIPEGSSNHVSNYLKTVLAKRITTTDFDIHYVQGGKGEPLILVHGGGMWLYSYRDNLPVLARDFSVYALDMPGHGYTQIIRQQPSYDLDMMAQALLEFMNALDLQRATLVGHSWGGGWVLYFSQKYPERVKRLILIDSSGLNVSDRWDWELLKYPLIGELLSKFITEGTVKSGLEDAFLNQSLVTPEMVKEIATPLLINSHRQAQYLLARHQDWRQTEQGMPKMITPTLIIWGADDKYLSVDFARQFGKRIPGAQVKVLLNSGHSVHEEHPQEVNRLIKEFVQMESR